ncbi:response regulator transcription factor [Hyphomicrobium sp.]|uniref:helix-turn-helix transcriptional regulator n=1 Tax=Hyphomicrobium sp. TaxID=82 RepID=UPI003F7213C3
MKTSITQDDVSKLGADMLQFICGIDECATPEAVLNGLHKVSLPNCQINVLGAALFPLQWGDWESVEKGKTVFLHKSVPAGWWDEHIELSRAHPGHGFLFAQVSLAPFTMSELMRMIEPLAIDRWPFELALKYGMRDRLNCPVGGRWVVSYWSRNVLCERLSDEARAILFMGGTFAAIRLQKVIGPQVSRIGKGVTLTPRELAVLRLLSIGHPSAEIAELLALGEETVRSHIKKAQSKLGVRARTHAVAQAIRRNLIP